MMVLLGYGGWLVAHDRLPLGAGLVVYFLQAWLRKRRKAAGL